MQVNLIINGDIHFTVVLRFMNIQLFNWRGCFMVDGGLLLLKEYLFLLLLTAF